MANDDYLIEVKNLQMYFPVLVGLLQRKVADVKAVDNICLSIRRGETLGLVGESGCGKTTTGRCILQLNKPTGGQVFFEGTELSRLGTRC
jgi:ABC-type oligopeptide transport system ATPase subunit